MLNVIYLRNNFDLMSTYQNKLENVANDHHSVFLWKLLSVLFVWKLWVVQLECGADETGW